VKTNLILLDDNNWHAMTKKGISQGWRDGTEIIIYLLSITCNYEKVGTELAK
jgi:hypothetical protein